MKLVTTLAFVALAASSPQFSYEDEDKLEQIGENGGDHSLKMWQYTTSMANTGATSTTTVTVGGDIGLMYYLPLDYDVGKKFTSN